MWRTFFAMVASIALLGVISALGLEGQIPMVERSDCYEKSASGQRLGPKSVYRRFNCTIVDECKKACTKEKEACKSFSFGLSPKGNGTCELGTETVKETADLKPIGAINDTEFELYTKKLGCSLVIDKTPNKKPATHPADRNSIPSTQKPDRLGDINNDPHPDGTRYQYHDKYRPLYGSDQYSDGTRYQHHDRDQPLYAPSHQYTPPLKSGDETPGRVGSELIAVASGVDTYLHPVHDIILSKRSRCGVCGEEHFQGEAHSHFASDSYYKYPPPNRGSWYGEKPSDHLDRDNRPVQDVPAKPDLPSYRPDDRYDYWPDRKPPYTLPAYGSLIPHPDEYYGTPPEHNYLGKPPDTDRYPDYSSYKPNDRPEDYHYYYYDPPTPLPVKPSGYYYETPQKPTFYEDNNPSTPQLPPTERPLPPPVTPEVTSPPRPIEGDRRDDKPEGGDCKGCLPNGGKSIVTHIVGKHGQQVTSIITDITNKGNAATSRDNACFRRVLAAKRVSRAFVKKAITCETVEECQRECASEKRFVCEGFNYRLDPTGRGKGDCELLDCPLSQLDLRRDILPDPNYDYYERDRNAVECERRRPQNRYGGSGYNGYGGYGVRSSSSYGGSYGSSWNYNSYSGGDYHRNYAGNRGGGSYNADRRYDYDDGRRPGDRWSTDDRPRRPYLPPSDRPPFYGSENNRRGDYPKYPSQDTDRPLHYLPPPNKPQDRILFEHEEKTHYLPPKVDTSSDWGSYGKSSQAYNQYGGYNYWYSKYDDWKPIVGTHLIPSGPDNSFDNHITPAVPPSRQPHRYDVKRDECSLRMASGFKLHKTVVGRLFSVQNIYDCELLCFKEKGFLCSSYAYRYTLPADNCYLSSKNHKELNYYTDVEPDRDFDLYTMNNRDKCAESIGVRGGDDSECFLRVRSGKRLHESVVKDSLTTKSAVECQITCLKATKFTCRAFSFRYGPPVIGGVIDNCQLTDCPFYELDPIRHFVPETAFEIYERASFGHGCEPDHFVILAQGNKNKVAKVDQLCYVGFSTPARLLPQAVRKAVYVPSEIECKLECSKYRHGTLFQCMSFSFRAGGSTFSPNCHLSDILQRDLLQDIDYVYDTNWKLFAWDTFTPDCVAIIYATEDGDNNHLGHGGDMDHKHDTSYYGLDTWRVYSVSGWPCRRGSTCIENKEAGFWYCELEGAESGSWDYCCRPDHQCGASYEYPYQCWNIAIQTLANILSPQRDASKHNRPRTSTFKTQPQIPGYPKPH
ncbi:unnamed protein product [Acanthoscelides obtectus]|uniref:Apple domain-containing protein n=1 Tax=Acanthoscelides obtectus TaxID=200917 RepID=A0A9P0KXX7_ACAOB|nr:unnamed protein product [Acanthoscelides obtectus]CAK1656730.1 hypothetical protein AOBTE_LOCUS19888 [Acanthoscelides obtectus]